MVPTIVEVPPLIKTNKTIDTNRGCESSLDSARFRVEQRTSEGTNKQRRIEGSQKAGQVGVESSGSEPPLPAPSFGRRFESPKSETTLRRDTSLLGPHSTRQRNPRLSPRPGAGGSFKGLALRLEAQTSMTRPRRPALKIPGAGGADGTGSGPERSGCRAKRSGVEAERGGGRAGQRLRAPRGPTGARHDEDRPPPPPTPSPSPSRLRHPGCRYRLGHVLLESQDRR